MRKDEPMTTAARRRKKAKNKARREERIALYVAIRMQEGKQCPEYMKGMPNHMLRRYLETGRLLDGT